MTDFTDRQLWEEMSKPEYRNVPGLSYFAEVAKGLQVARADVEARVLALPMAFFEAKTWEEAELLAPTVEEMR